MKSNAANAVKPLKILVVEDSQRMAAALKKGLTEESYSVTLEHDGVSGLK